MPTKNISVHPRHLVGRACSVKEWEQMIMEMKRTPHKFDLLDENNRWDKVEGFPKVLAKNAFLCQIRKLDETV